MQYRNRSVLATVALLAVGAVAGAWITAKTGQFPLSFDPVPAAAQTVPDVNFRTGFGPIVKKVQPAVVSIISTTRAQQRTSQQRRAVPNLPPGFEDFFGGQIPFDMPQQGPSRGLGSGVIITPDGYIVTNHHVVDGADTVEVQVQDNRTFTAKVVGKDDKSDVAVLKIEATNLPYMPFADSDVVEVGDVVLAMGNPFGIGQTVTMGIVGATHRNTPEQIEEYEDFIQTDAAINPGNSGGALVNIKGELIGINVAILSRSGGNQGVGFAIPAKTAKFVFDQIRDHGKVSRGRLGVSIQSVNADIGKSFGMTSDFHGALIGQVDEGTPAAKAGLKVGDIVLEMDGYRIANSDDLRTRVASTSPGTRVTLKVFRDKAEIEVPITLGALESGETLSSSAEPLNQTGPRLGVSVEVAKAAGKSGNSALRITAVEPGSAAEEAGLRPGDLILQVNRKPVADPTEFRNMVQAAKDDPLLLYVESTSDRGTQQVSGRHFVTVTPRG